MTVAVGDTVTFNYNNYHSESDIVGEREGWREEVRAGQLQLLSEDLVLLLRNAGWGGRKSCHERRRGALRERRRWELDDGDDGCVGERALRCWRIRSSA